MLLIDTSVWSDHLRRHDAELAARLQVGGVLMHPFVMGEIACGAFPRRTEALALMDTLACAPVLGHAEWLAFIDRHALSGQGVGFVDIHLLASALLAGAAFWTRDRRLAQAALSLGIASPLGRR